MPKAIVSLFAYGDVKPQTVASLVAEMRLAPWMDLWVEYENALISLQRSQSLTRFLEQTDADVCLMVDHDMVWEPGDLTMLAHHCHETRGLVSGAYPRRAFGKGATLRFRDPGNYTYGEDTLVPGAVVGAGFLAIHREAAQRIATTLPKTKDGWPFFVLIVEDPATGAGDGIWGEDYSFSLRARKAGVPVLIWLKPNLQHVGSYTYRMIDAMATVPEAVPVTFSVQDPVIADLPADLGAYLDLPIETVGQNLREGTARLARLWRADGEEIEWYRDPEVSRAYMFDLANWHLNGQGAVIDAMTKDLAGQRCLDFGAGIGTWALILAGRGNTVEYVEPSDELARLVEYRARKRGIQLKRVASPAPEAYDSIICWHVLEHVNDPLPVAEQVVGALVPGGLLITQSNFRRSELHPQHHVLPEGWNEQYIWEALGLEPAGPWRWHKKTGHENGEGREMCLSLTARSQSRN